MSEGIPHEQIPEKFFPVVADLRALLAPTLFKVNIEEGVLYLTAVENVLSEPEIQKIVFGVQSQFPEFRIENFAEMSQIVITPLDIV